VIPANRNQVALAIARLSTRILPPTMRQWGFAMQNEVEAIERADRATMFALGCLGFALQQALIFQVLRPLQFMAGSGVHADQEAIIMNIRDDLLQHPKRMAAFCAITATALGLVYMNVAGAPVAYLAMNLSALVIGFLLAGIAALCARSARLSAGAISLILAVLLLLTSLFGTTAGGATRWIALGSLSVQPSLLILPVMTICFAHSRDMPSTVAVAIASLALAVQPDRGMSGALTSGMLVLALVRPEKNTMIAAAAAISGFVASMLQADVQPAMPYVDQILYSSFDVHPLAGMAVLAGAALMVIPSIIGGLYDIDRLETYAVFGVVWLAVIVAAALGNYPTPLVGYGGSAIIGYIVSLLGLPQRRNLNALDRQEVDTSVSAPEQHDLRMGFA
jgi:Cell cycle protein